MLLRFLFPLLFLFASIPPSPIMLLYMALPGYSFNPFPKLYFTLSQQPYSTNSPFSLPLMFFLVSLLWFHLTVFFLLFSFAANECSWYECAISFVPFCPSFFLSSFFSFNDHYFSSNFPESTNMFILLSFHIISPSSLSAPPPSLSLSIFLPSVSFFYTLSLSLSLSTFLIFSLFHHVNLLYVTAPLLPLFWHEIDFLSLTLHLSNNHTLFVPHPV